MGRILGIEAVVAIITAAEAAGTIAEAAGEITMGADATEAIVAGAEAGIEAGTEAGIEASTAVTEEGDALTAIVEKLAAALQKLAKMTEEYIVIDQTFKAAKSILEDLAHDTAQERTKRLEVLVCILTLSCTIIENLNNWLQDHAKDCTTLAGITVSVDRGVLARFLSPLGAAAKTVLVLSKQVGDNNLYKHPITDGEVAALRTGLITVLQALLSLAKFKEEHVNKVQVFCSLPIGTEEVSNLQAKMGLSAHGNCH